MPLPSRANVLQLAILGLLHRAPMHGYELRKQLNAMLGPFRAFSYGSLYPGLRDLADKSLINASTPASGALAGRRGRIIYTLGADGAAQLESMLGEAGPATWEDDNFDVRFAFFADTDRETRLRILEGRRLRMAERLDAMRPTTSTDRTARPADDYARELRRHGIEQVEREIRWLDGLIEAERAGRPPGPIEASP